MDGLRIVEYTPELAVDALTIRNAIFPPISLEDWLKTTTMSGVLAYLDDEVVGCIPMDRREMLLAPGVTIPVVFENAVGTRDDMRSKGIGSAMIRAARRYLGDRVDALMVYRGAERSPGYRFYVKSGHHDMLYLRTVRWEPAAGGEGGAAGGLDEIAADAEAIHQVFSATYAGYAGFAPRHVGYQRRQLDHQIYTVLPQETLYFRYPAVGDVEAYCIAGVRTGDRADGTMALLEMGARGSEAASTLLEEVGAEARGRGLVVTGYTSYDDPFRDLLRATGFMESPRGLMILAQPIDPQRLFGRTCDAPELLEDLRITAWTPRMEALLHEGAGARTDVCIEAKSAELARLLCRRLDVHSAAEQGIITVRNGTEDVLRRLSEARPLARWTYHAIDYI